MSCERGVTAREDQSQSVVLHWYYLRLVFGMKESGFSVAFVP
jgi:hypothetical protein